MTVNVFCLAPAGDARHWSPETQWLDWICLNQISQARSRWAKGTVQFYHPNVRARIWLVEDDAPVVSDIDPATCWIDKSLTGWPGKLLTIDGIKNELV